MVNTSAHRATDRAFLPAQQLQVRGRKSSLNGGSGRAARIRCSRVHSRTPSEAGWSSIGSFQGC